MALAVWRAFNNNNNNNNNKLTFWPFDLESDVRVKCDVAYTSVPILVFVLDVGPMYATDRETDVRQTSSDSIIA